MPLSRMENTTFAMPSIIDFHDMGLRTVFTVRTPKGKRLFNAYSNKPAGWRGWFATDLMQPRFRAQHWPKSVDFHDAENRQRPCRMIIRQNNLELTDKESVAGRLPSELSLGVQPLYGKSIAIIRTVCQMHIGELSIPITTLSAAALQPITCQDCLCEPPPSDSVWREILLTVDSKIPTISFSRINPPDTPRRPAKNYTQTGKHRKSSTACRKRSLSDQANDSGGSGNRSDSVRLVLTEDLGKRKLSSR
ncbi:hypothetical protein TNCV_4790941 [Trichonephila clavipes]|nr:hypothetical protein TNCV_4790941 [Trichonephila clavipes]